ncbi:MAG: hypothetical protein FWC79_05155 [Oscillospiraceae bacterium]|nr:hypothetical protein [Oscillospiraceae bacterium]
MAVLINFKICDNSKDCNGLAACPTGAFDWDEEKQTLVIHDDLCVNCAKCECCSVDAIKVTHSDEEYERVKKEIEDDPRTLNDLFIDRFGAAPIQEEYSTTEENIDTVLHSSRPFMLELYSEDTIECLLKSIPIREILQKFDSEATFRKIEVTSDKLLDRYGVKELPALVFIRDNKVLGSVEGYFTDENNRELYNKIHELTTK